MRPLVLFLCLSCSSLSGCGKDLPPQHPVGELSARAAARLPLITMIVKDEGRARQVVVIHEELIELAPRFNRVRGERIANLSEILADGPSSIESSLSEVRAAEVQTYARYRQLMLNLRALVSEKEYLKLMALR